MKRYSYKKLHESAKGCAVLAEMFGDPSLARRRLRSRLYNGLPHPPLLPFGEQRALLRWQMARALASDRTCGAGFGEVAQPSRGGRASGTFDLKRATDGSRIPKRRRRRGGFLARRLGVRRIGWRGRDGGRGDVEQAGQQRHRVYPLGYEMKRYS